jgi:hypothetical protein
MDKQPIRAEARLRYKNQLTLPERIAAQLEAKQDDLLVFEVDPAAPRQATIRIVPRTFAGSMTGIYGSTRDLLRDLREDREAW